MVRMVDIYAELDLDPNALALMVRQALARWLLILADSYMDVVFCWCNPGSADVASRLSFGLLPETGGLAPMRSGPQPAGGFDRD